MRLSGLVVAAILLVSATLLAQHSSGGGSSSGGSHGGSAGGSSFSVSSAGGYSTGSSHVASTGSSSRPSSSSSKASPGKENASLGNKSSRSLFHPFRKPKPGQNAAFKPPVPCLKGICAVCPPGESRNGRGACVIAGNACLSGQSSYRSGFACGVPYWSNDCSALAERLAAQRRQMPGQSDYGQSLRLRLLQQQYDECLWRFGSYPFSALLFDTP